MELPKTEERYLEMLKMAFLEGQRSVEAELKYERWGDMDPYASKTVKYNFDTWASERWQYGKNQLHLANRSEVK